MHTPTTQQRKLMGHKATPFAGFLSSGLNSIHGALFAALTTFSLTAIAFEQATQDSPLVFSYVKHDYVEQVALPLIERTYARLGIDVKFIEMPSHREMVELSLGHVDGSVIASKTLFERYPNIITVPPVITESVFVLLCAKAMPCDTAVLESGENTVTMTEASERAVKYRFPNLTTDIYALNLLTSIPGLVRTQRFEYGIYVAEKNELTGPTLHGLDYIELFRNPAHHVLASEHGYLVESVSHALESELRQAENPAN